MAKQANNAKVNDAMANIVNVVIEAMQNGTAPWQRPWATRGVRPTNISTGNEYTGGNALYLSILGGAFGCDYWVGFAQAKKMGGSVRKGEKGTAILRPIRVKRERDDGTEYYFTAGFKLAYVWNVSQVDGIELPAVDMPERVLDVDKLDAFVANTGANLAYDGGDRAFYRPATDSVHMPAKDSFKSEGGFYGTLLHELTHWTGHKSRLDRSKFKNDEKLGYAFEELVAELGAYYASEQLDCPNEAENHASYLESWLKALQSDPSYLWQAAALAEKAAGFLLAAGEAKKQAA